MDSLNRTKLILGYGGTSRLARACRLTPGAVHKWFTEGVLPATEITEMCGKRITHYGLIIEEMTGGAVTDAELREDNQRFRETRKSAA